MRGVRERPPGHAGRDPVIGEHAPERPRGERFGGPIAGHDESLIDERVRKTVVGQHVHRHDVARTDAIETARSHAIFLRHLARRRRGPHRLGLRRTNSREVGDGASVEQAAEIRQLSHGHALADEPERRAIERHHVDARRGDDALGGEPSVHDGRRDFGRPAQRKGPGDRQDEDDRERHADRATAAAPERIRQTAMAASVAAAVVAPTRRAACDSTAAGLSTTSNAWRFAHVRPRRTKRRDRSEPGQEPDTEPRRTNRARAEQIAPENQEVQSDDEIWAVEARERRQTSATPSIETSGTAGFNCRITTATLVAMSTPPATAFVSMRR